MRNYIIVFTLISLSLTVTGLFADIGLVGSCDMPGQALNLDVSEGYAYIAVRDEGLFVIDISDPENPDEVCAYEPDGIRPYDVFVVDNYAYLGDWGRGLVVIDISDPENPDDLGSQGLPDGAWEVFVQGNYAYVGGDDAGLRVIDISNPEDLDEVGFYNTQGNATGVFVSGNYAYVSDRGSGLRIIDISDPEDPDEVDYYWHDNCWILTAFVSGDFAYLTDYRNGFHVINISDPDDPNHVGHYNNLDGAQDVFVAGTYAFVVDNNGLSVIDVSNPQNPREVDSYDTQSSAMDVKVVRNYAYVTDQNGGFFILDVSDYTITGPVIEVLDEELDFGETGVNVSEEMTLTISNIGIEDLVVSYISIEGDYFSVDFEDEFTIVPDEETDVAVTFIPEERGNFEGTLTITSNDEENEEVEVSLIGEGVGPVISVNPHELNFGVVGIDLTEELPLTIRNRGLNDLVISSISNETEFFTYQFDEEITLEPGSRIEIPVTFSPVQGIDYEDTITISCNDPDNETVEVPLSGRGVGALIDTDPDIINFGDVGLERSRDRQLTIRNEGQLDLHVLEIVVEDPYFSVQFDGEFVIEPDRSHDITVTFAPERSGEFEGSLFIASDDRQNEEFIVPLHGIGVGPRIAVDQEIMCFDMQRVNRSAALMLTITAVGLTDLTVSDVSVEGDYFSIDFDEEVFIELNSRFQVMVTYAPADDGIHEAALTISSDDENSPQKTVVLTGSAIDGVISDTPGSALSVYVDGDFAYVADDEAGLLVINVFNPEAPREVGSYNSDGNCSGVVVVDNFAYVADGSGGMLVVDLSSPQEPELIAVVETPGEALDVDVVGEYAFVADGESGLRVINIYDPERPAEVGHCDTPGGARGVAVQGDFAYIADDIRGLRIINVSDPEEPEEVGSYNTEGWAWDVFVLGNIAYVADERYGLRIIDVSDPGHPSELGSYDTNENAYGVTVYGDYAYVADGEGGLCIIHIADTENPVLVDTYYVPDCVVDVFISGDYAYVAGSESGLLVLDASNYVSVEDITDPTLPTEFSLTVFPNPFNITAMIRYGLPYPSNVSVQIYNPLGQRIGTLFEGHQQTGIYTSNLNANDLPSGLYFVRLEASGEILTQKLMLIR